MEILIMGAKKLFLSTFHHATDMFRLTTSPYSISQISISLAVPYN